MSSSACASCGASLPPGADACDLCGTPVEGVSEADRLGGPPCPRCENVPPAGSAYCNRCGSPLPADVARPEAAVASTERPSSAVGRRAFAVAAVGIAAVVGLYAMTALRDRAAPDPKDPEPSGPEAVGEAAPIPSGAPALPDSLQAAADAFAAEGTASGWYESGRYYLTAAFNASQTDPTASVRWARRAIEDFERSLALADDPDVRFALAEAATFDPADPMRPIQEIRAILAAEPDHLGATVMLGERRMMIGRADSARVAFERVLALAPPGDPARERAERRLAEIEAGG